MGYFLLPFMGEGVRRTDEGKKMSRQKRIRPAQITQASERAKILRQNMTEAERRLWHHLRDRRLQGYKFRRQQPIGRYIADFVCLCPKLIVEADGSQHMEQTEYDAERSAYLLQQGFTVLRFWNNEILQQTDAVLALVLAKLRELN